MVGRGNDRERRGGRDMEPMEEGGEWWLPDTPDIKVSGVLRIDDKGSNQLTLIGELRSHLDDAERHDHADGTVEYRFTEDTLHLSGRYPRVLGQVGTKAYTLEGGFQIRHNTNLLGGLPSETIKFSQVFSGVWLQPGEELAFDRVSVSMQWFTHWIGDSAIKETHQWAEGRPVSFTLRGSLPPNRRLRLGGGLTVYLRLTIGLAGDGIVRRGLVQRFVFETRSTSVLPLESLMQTTARLQALVSIGTGRTAGFDELVLNHPDLTQGPPSDPRQFRGSIDYFAEWSARDDNLRPPDRHDMLFTLKDLGGFPAVGRWLLVANRYHHQLDQVMATRYGDRTVSDRLLNRVAALEGFHKLLAGRTLTLKQRLIACAALAGTPFQDLVPDVARWAEVAKRARNDIGHGSDPGGFEAANTLFVADAAYWLFVLCLLREMDAPEAVFIRMAGTPTYRWLKHNLADALL